MGIKASLDNDELIVTKWMEAYHLHKDKVWITEQVNVPYESWRQRFARYRDAGLKLPRLKGEVYDYENTQRTVKHLQRIADNYQPKKG